MVEREKVIKGLELCTADIPIENGIHRDDMCQKCPYHNEKYAYCFEKDKLMQDALALLKEQEQTPGEWVSVKDRMPEKSGEYLCWFGANKVAIGPAIVTYVDEWKAFGRLVSLEKFPNITHWMPLPEPPKEG